jgi:hypothetical protein
VLVWAGPLPDETVPDDENPFEVVLEVLPEVPLDESSSVDGAVVVEVSDDVPELSEPALLAAAVVEVRASARCRATPPVATVASSRAPVVMALARPRARGVVGIGASWRWGAA